MAVIQFKRGAASRWKELNVILEAGQPGFVTDENRLKIGDGLTAWNDLPYVGEASVVNVQTHYDFPNIGRENVIYKAEAEKSIYQWNAAALKYELLGSTEISGDLSNIQIIHGGNAFNE
jgi:hypothetical protein